MAASVTTKVFRSVALDVEDASQQRSGLGYEKTARLEEQLHIETLERGFEGGGIFRDPGLRVKFQPSLPTGRW
jgi:hypothetical protein